MNPLLQRIAAALDALRRHPGLQRLARLVPEPVATVWRTFRHDHPDVARVALPIAGAVVLIMILVSYDYARTDDPGDVDLPDFNLLEEIDARKSAFLEFMQPIIEYRNDRIRERRERLLDVLAELEEGDEATLADHAWLAEQAQRLRVDAEDDLGRARQLKPRIDIVPVSLALAQAALESAWGTSRFARLGNNLFGQWCFEPGCGIVPKRRPEGEIYEVEAFDTVSESVQSYMQNINSHPAYAPARRIRAQARAEGRVPTGSEMAAGLVNYAAIGEKYVEHLRGMIRRNNLEALARAQ